MPKLKDLGPGDVLRVPGSSRTLLLTQDQSKRSRTLVDVEDGSVHKLPPATEVEVPVRAELLVQFR